MPVIRTCCGAREDIISFACSGRSNVGQLTNDAAKDLDRLGEARFLCLAAVGAGDREVIESAQRADQVVILDGCDKGCGRRIMESAGFHRFLHIDVTSLGIEKCSIPAYLQEELEGLVATAVLLSQGHRDEEQI